MKSYQQTGLARSITRYFQEYLPTLRGMSRRTIQTYRDGMILFLGFSAKVRIRIKVAGVSHFKVATVSHIKVAGPSHFEVATHSHFEPATCQRSFIR